MKRVAVVRGGPSSEHEVSLSTGNTVLRALREQDVLVKDLVITKKGEWLDAGLIRTPEQALSGIDVVFNALHGIYGENGKLQRYLETHKIPYTGSRPWASSVAFNKVATKEFLKDTLTHPRHTVLKGDSLWAVASLLDSVEDSLGSDLFIKPIADGSSHKAFRVVDRESLENTIALLLPTYGEVLIEEYITGREATVAILENFRGDPHYALPVIEIVPAHEQGFFTTEAKYQAKAELVCPGRFTYEEKQQLAAAAIAAHKHLQCSHYSRSDFIVRDGVIYFLEINTLPGLTEQSLLPRAAQTVGLEYKNLVTHILSMAHV